MLLLYVVLAVKLRICGKGENPQVLLPHIQLSPTFRRHELSFIPLVFQNPGFYDLYGCFDSLGGRSFSARSLIDLGYNYRKQ